MFVAMAHFPTVSLAQERDFIEWFSWSNEQLREIEGLEGRRLLRATDGTYSALVEHQSAETFAAMHTSSAAVKVHAHLAEILDEGPRATTYEVVTTLSPVQGCCGGGHGGCGSQA